MENPKIPFYFAYNTPYSFLANTRLERALARFSPEIESNPSTHRAPQDPPAGVSERLRHLLEDVQRFAVDYGLKLAGGTFADSRKACLWFFFYGAV